VWRGGEVAALRGFPGADFVVSVAGDHRLMGGLEGKILRAGVPRGTHGHAPDLEAVDASFFIAGPGIPAGLDFGPIDMRDVGRTLAGRLGLTLPQAEGRDLLSTRRATLGLEKGPAAPRPPALPGMASRP